MTFGISIFDSDSSRHGYKSVQEQDALLEAMAMKSIAIAAIVVIYGTSLSVRFCALADVYSQSHSIQINGGCLLPYT